MRIAVICNEHGFQRGSECGVCTGEKPNQAFYTSKDKLWEFETTHYKPGTEIRTKGQWKALLKKNNAHDDYSTKEVVNHVFTSKEDRKRKWLKK